MCIRDRPLRDVVFKTLRQAILKGELEPGEPVSYTHLCDRGDHWGVYCDPVFRAEGPPDLHRKEHRKHGIRRESYEILNNL